MVRDKGFYWDLFVATLQLSAFTVGGGFVIVPLMRRKFIREKQWLDEDEMLDLTGDRPVGARFDRHQCLDSAWVPAGRVSGGAGDDFRDGLPPLFILSLVSMFYAAFKSNEYVVLAMKGMQAGVAAIIFDVVITMGKNVLSRKRVMPWIILTGSFAAVFFSM